MTSCLQISGKQKWLLVFNKLECHALHSTAKDAIGWSTFDCKLQQRIAFVSHKYVEDIEASFNKLRVCIIWLLSSPDSSYWFTWWRRLPIMFCNHLFLKKEKKEGGKGILRKKIEWLNTTFYYYCVLMLWSLTWSIYYLCTAAQYTKLACVTWEVKQVIKLQI